MRTAVAIRSLLFSLVLLALSQVSFGQIGVGISVGFGPPAIPIYEQPICPVDGYLWTPGFWNYDDGDGYFWVPGTWIEPPEVGFLWTPGYWGWGGSAFFFHEGYWGSHVGFYGGINYGFGYGGFGFEGGRWDGGHFAYNTYVSHVNTTIIHNTYNTRITNVTNNRVSFNGGAGGVNAKETEQERSFANERHVGPVAAQTQHIDAARGNPELRASANHGKPPIAATSRAGDFKGGAVAAKNAGAKYKAPPANAARPATSEARPAANEAHSETGAAGAHANPAHASDIEAHKSTSPNTGNAATDKKYQQQQDKLVAKQNQEHQKLQQQQDKEHQQAAQKNYNDTQKQQMEQRHSQQSQQLEQRHSTQTQQMQTRQAPASHPSGGRH